MSMREIGLGILLAAAGCNSEEAERQGQIEEVKAIAVGARDAMIGKSKVHCRQNICIQETTERPGFIPESYHITHIKDLESHATDELILTKSGSHAFHLQPLSDENECTIRREAMTKEIRNDIIYPTIAECNQIREAAMVAFNPKSVN